MKKLANPNREMKKLANPNREMKKLANPNREMKKLANPHEQLHYGEARTQTPINTHGIIERQAVTLAAECTAKCLNADTQ